jgi:hypothetical protein
VLKTARAALNETYQQVAYLRGLQLYQSNSKTKPAGISTSRWNFRSEKNGHRFVLLLAGRHFQRKGRIQFQQKAYERFLTQAKMYNDLPDESSLMMGNTSRDIIF